MLSSLCESLVNPTSTHPVESFTHPNSTFLTWHQKCVKIKIWHISGKDKRWQAKEYALPTTEKDMGIMGTFAKFAFTCALSTFLQETWLNCEGLLEAFYIVINSLPKSILATKSAESIFKGVIEMIKHFRDYFKSQNQFPIKNKAKNKAKATSEWVR